jgi:hypothetical protein
LIYRMDCFCTFCRSKWRFPAHGADHYAASRPN